MTDSFWWVPWIASAVAVGLAVLSWRRDVRKLYEMRRHSSRFPLFAVRDQLIQLVVVGKMSEDDDAWQAAYTTVNHLLHLDRKLTIWSFTLRLLKSKRAEERDADLKRSRELLGRKLRKASERVPGFRNVLRDLDSGLLSLVADRTTKLEFLSFRSLVYSLQSVRYVLSLMLQGGTASSQLQNALSRTPGPGSAALLDQRSRNLRDSMA